MIRHPPNFPEMTMTRFPAGTLASLRAIAAARGTTTAELTRQAVLELIKAHLAAKPKPKRKTS